MILFAFDAWKKMAEVLGKAGLASGGFRAAQFENGEWHIEIGTPVRGQECLVLGSIAPPDGQMLSTLLLGHTLKKEGAREVRAVLPYLGYARHDRDKPGESLATAWSGAIVQASGIDSVVTVDVHSEYCSRLFPVPLISLSPAETFARAFARFGLRDATIVAPDEGAITRCEAVKKAAGSVQATIPFFRKQRTAAGILHTGLIGAVGRKVVIVDDILDTGGTLVSACEKLREGGAEEIDVMVTHGLFTGERWRKLWGLGVRRIFCTDSVPIPAGVQDARIEQLSVVPLLEQQLCQPVLSG
ncbi:MAG TPA: ribose-phosphate diphosphokinase [Bryobacteraceae bacterium]|nr:ribose-phosphate diphosphokinase [Bryobacteraceae bacterium]